MENRWEVGGDLHRAMAQVPLARIDQVALLLTTRKMQSLAELWKLCRTGELVNAESTQRAIERFDRRLRGGLPGRAVRVFPGRPAQPGLQSLPDVVLLEVASGLGARDLLRLGASGRHLRASASSEPAWKGRSVDLSGLRSYEAWRRALLRGCGSTPWNCAHEVRVPQAKSVRVAHELLSFFGARLRLVDLRAAHHLAVLDYFFLLEARRAARDGPVLLLRAPSREESRSGRFTDAFVARLFHSRMSCTGLIGVSRTVLDD